MEVLIVRFLEDKRGRAFTNDEIAKAMGRAPSAVAPTIERLKAKNIVNQVGWHRVELNSDYSLMDLIDGEINFDVEPSSSSSSD